MKYCKKKIVWNVLEKNWLKVNLKILCYNYLWLKLCRTSRISCDEKCDDHWYIKNIELLEEWKLW